MFTIVKFFQKIFQKSFFNETFNLFFVAYVSNHDRRGYHEQINLNLENKSLLFIFGESLFLTSVTTVHGWKLSAWDEESEKNCWKRSEPILIFVLN